MEAQAAFTSTASPLQADIQETGVPELGTEEAEERKGT